MSENTQSISWGLSNAHIYRIYNKKHSIKAAVKDFMGLAAYGRWSRCSLKGFKKEIRSMFSNIDEVKTAEDHMYGLKQTSSALTYTTEF
ncbi:hypothetical protein VC83_02707 [Pseudogymnoascus destructans]|uniref:Uncharacterized protein n=1 Tax=Pseudogymnoascus destructans TaxID=655981 RepID=A0A177AIM1_9PEZI|nr:uncharacterized protein VC83_02707 [Pseudogymnoascus destructans]OAF61103.1 hypothetical protein VC83_02707 [Pseudogymnoascus destructans]